MSISWGDFVGSRSFKFIVGEKADGTPTEFSVHEEAIARLSENLRTLLTGELIEARAGCTSWDNVSKQTFEQFSQFAYTGDYSIPEPEFIEEKLAIQTSVGTPPMEPPEPGPSEEVVVDDGWGDFSSRVVRNGTKKKDKKGKKSRTSFGFRFDDPPPPPAEEVEPPFDLPSTPPREIYEEQPIPKLNIDFHSLSYELTAPRTNFFRSCEPTSEFFKHYSYSNVFLSHARLYVLADYRIVDSLKSLALYKLYKTLCVFELDSENMCDIVNLARFAYSEEGQGSEGGNGIGLLRDLVCRYIVENSVALTANERFMELLYDGGEFAKDIWTYEIQRNH